MKHAKYTALITGATGGLGSAISAALLSRGQKVILCGRRQEALKKLKTELTDKFEGVAEGNIKILVTDLAHPHGVDKLATYIHEEDINLIIQAAGCEGCGPFHRSEETTIEQNLKLNLQLPMLLTHAIIEDFSQRKDACLVFVGSAFGSIGYAGFAPYCASKFGLRGFTEALQREYKDAPLDIMHFSPRATQTSFNTAKVEALNTALGNGIDTPEVVAKALMKALTTKPKRYQVGWPEKLFVRLNGLLPELVDQALGKQLKKIKQFF